MPFLDVAQQKTLLKKLWEDYEKIIKLKEIEAKKLSYTVFIRKVRPSRIFSSLAKHPTAINLTAENLL